MDILNELLNYYEVAPDKYSEEKIKTLDSKSDNFKKCVFNYITENHAKKFGFPDVSLINKAIKQAPEEKNNVRKFFWKVCARCKEKYAYRLEYCPVCWMNGKKVGNSSDSYAVATDDVIPKGLHNLNMCTPTESYYAGKNCYSCDSQNVCKNFGNEDWNCSRQDFEYCPCRNCCASLKSQKKKFSESNKTQEIENDKWEKI